jgi:RNA polymerase sigma factor (sigma-70 family)
MLDSPHDFATTRWTLVVKAGQKNQGGAAALAELCQHYWYPIYAYARRWTGDVAEAQDATQEFFARLLEKGTLALASPERGRFRSFLLVAMRNFLADAAKKARAAKRGGGTPGLSLDFESGESRFRLEPAHEMTPDRLFERAWTLALLARVMERLRNEYASAGKAEQFPTLEPLIAGPRDDASYASAAVQLQTSEANARQLASRLRKRYRELLREEVAQTVAEPEEVDDELQGLLKTLS